MLSTSGGYSFRICSDSLVRVESNSGARLGAYRMPRGCTMHGFILRFFDPYSNLARYRVGDLDY